MKKLLSLRGLLVTVAMLSTLACGSLTEMQPSTNSPAANPPSIQQTTVQPTATASNTQTVSQPASSSSSSGNAIIVGGRVINDVVDVVNKTRPAVVNIVNQQAGNTGRSLQDVGAGSGVIFDKSGLILTNNHVVEGAQALRVSLPDGTNFDGQLVGTDPRTDLAVVRINPNGKDLPTIPFGDSSRLQIGETVIAIGNALALPGGPTVTTGVVSALNRSIQEENGARLIDLVQTDAAINPGNSGGALINLQGQLIGINTAIAQAPGGGIGFAISVNTAKQISQELVQAGRVSYSCLGISDYVANTSAVYNQYNLAPVPGVVIIPVPNSPAANAGLRRLDIVTAINGVAITDEAGLIRELRKYKAGQTVTINFVRGNQKGQVQVTLTDCSNLG